MSISIHSGKKTHFLRISLQDTQDIIHPSPKGNRETPRKIHAFSFKTHSVNKGDTWLTSVWHPEGTWLTCLKGILR